MPRHPALPNSLIAQEQLSQRELDVWGRFGAGSWTQARIVTETLDESGNVTSRISTDVRSTLTNVLARRPTVRITVNVEAGGPIRNCAANSPARILRREAGTTSRREGAGARDPNGGWPRLFGPLARGVVQAGGQKTVTKLCQCDAQAPFVLSGRRKSSTPRIPPWNGKKRKKCWPSTCHTASDRKSSRCRSRRSTQKTAQGSTVTVDVTSVEVPGGLVNRTVKELDSQGHLVRRRTVELVDFKTVDDDDVPQWHCAAAPQAQRQTDYAP